MNSYEAKISGVYHHLPPNFAYQNSKGSGKTVVWSSDFLLVAKINK